MKDKWMIMMVMIIGISYGNRFAKIYEENEHDLASCSIISTMDGGYTVIGKSSNEDVGNVIVFKFLEDGTIKWVKKFQNGYCDIPRSVIQTKDGGYAIAWYTQSFGGDCGILVLKLDRKGNIEWAKVYGNANDIETPNSIIQTDDNGYLIVGRKGDFHLYSDEIFSLGYNNNRNIFRERNTEIIHLVHSSLGEIIYRNSQDGGVTWRETKIIGDGKFPAIALSSNHLPVITWTDESGGLWYRRKISPTEWGTLYHIYNPWAFWMPRVNSPPSIAVVPSFPEDSVYIIATLHTPANGPVNLVGVYSFMISQPLQGSWRYIEGGIGPSAGPIYIYQYEYEEEKEFYSQNIEFENGTLFKVNKLPLDAYKKGKIKIEIFDISGRVVASFLTSSLEDIWNSENKYTNKLPAASYFIIFKDLNKQKIFSHKVIKLK